MRYFISAALLFLVCVGVFFSCAKYSDPKPVTDPRLTNPYCNDPNAVNYNWGFPGKPDNSICFYPNQLFEGKYEYHDSVFLASNGFFIYTDSLTLNIYSLSQTKIAVTGFCSNGDSMILTASPTYVATVDTTEGDSTLINWGQHYCGIGDTVSGTIIKDRLDSPTVLYIQLHVAADTNVVTIHAGTARKIQ